MPVEKTRARAWGLALAALVVVLAVAARLWLLGRRGPAALDELTYLRCAESVLAGRGFVVPIFGLDFSLFVPPGYPVLLIPFQALFGYDVVHVPVVLAQALLSLLTAGLLYVTARRLAGRLAGFVAGAAFALHPYVTFYSNRLLTETLALFLFGAFLFYYLDPNQRKAKTAAAFALLGLAALTRPIFAFVGAAAAACLLLGRQEGGRRQRLAHVAVAVGAFAVVVAPWAIRNTARAGRPVLITYASGKLLYEGNYTLSREADPPSARKLRKTEEFRTLEARHAGEAVALELAYQDLAGRRAREIIAADKTGFLRLSAQRLGHFFALYPTLRERIAAHNPVFVRAYPLVGAYTLSLYVLALAGLGGTPGVRFRVFIPAAAAVTAGIHCVTISLLRYRLPVDLLLTLAAGAGVAYVARTVSTWRARRTG